MAAKLVAEEGVLKGLVLSLDDGEQWVIGRDPDACQLLVEDPSTSRKHLICRTTPNGILLENLSETNPVQVNQQEVKEPRLLHNGDAVKIGDGTFRFYAEAAAQLFQEEDEKELPYNTDTLKEELVNEHKETEIEKESDDEKNTKKKAGVEMEPEEQKPSTLEELSEISENGKNSSENSLFPEEEGEYSSAIQSEVKQPEKPQDPPTNEQLSEEKSHQDIKGSAMELSENEENIPSAPTTKREDSSNENLIFNEISDDGEKKHDSIFDEEPSSKHELAEINFGILDTGRWLLKVISGPNNGAEFSMQAGNSYIIGTDPNACDIVFHDTSVSRQHTRITINQDDALNIEDLKSRNGTLIDGETLQGKRTLANNCLVAVGTTSFVVFDREGEMQTIISPLMPSIVKVLQTEPKKTEEEKAAAAQALLPLAQESEKLTQPHHNTNLGAFILIGILTGVFVIVGIGTTTLFKSEPIAVTQNIDPLKTLSTALDPFPSVKYSYNPSTGQLLLVGHVLTASDKSQILYNLQGLSFVRNLDDNGVIIDEYVWREINQVLEKNPDWKKITVMSTTPGRFVVTGYLQTQNQADRLAEYLSANFSYPYLLENRTDVEQVMQASINTILQSKGLRGITAKLDNGEVVLTGGVPTEKIGDIAAVISEIKNIRGVRNVLNSTKGQAADQSLVNISDKYEVTGISNQGGNMSVVINGRILMKGDILDGMTVTSIQPSMILLEKEGIKYKIDFNR